MYYASAPGFDFRWRPNIFNSILFKTRACERERIYLIVVVVVFYFII